MSADKPPREPIDWKARGLDWVFNQGISTILLLLICGAMWYGIPWARTCMKEDMREIHETHKAAIDKTIDAFKEDQERDQRLIEKLMSGKHLVPGEAMIARP